MGIVRVVARGAGQEDRPNPQRLVEGNPLRHIWPAYETGNEQCAVGIWGCEPGA